MIAIVTESDWDWSWSEINFPVVRLSFERVFAATFSNRSISSSSKSVPHSYKTLE